MLSYEQLQYLTTFANASTLSEAAERIHLSQPTMTRYMKRVEAAFGVPLFERTKNSIRLNETGLVAAGEAATLLKQTEEMMRRVRVHDRAGHTISIGSSAAVQIPDLIRRISERYPDMTLSTELKKPAALLEGLHQETYQLILLPYPPTDDDLIAVPIGEEHLMFFLPKQHRFARRTSLTLAEMNGESLLLFSQIGFWYDLITEKMPDSRFLIQHERYSLDELIVNSVLPCFTTNLVRRSSLLEEKRVCVPIADPAVNVTYSLICKKENRKRFAPLFAETENR